MSRTHKTPKTSTRRTKMFWIRVSEDEMAAIKTAASKDLRSSSAWARIVLLKAAAAALLLCLALPARALDHWTWQDTAWEAGSAALLVLDWGNTRDIAWQNGHQVRNGRRYPERGEGNPILGRHPSAQRVDLYFASAIVTHAAVSVLLPSGWRRTWQASTVGLELVVVGGNVQAGLSFRF